MKSYKDLEDLLNEVFRKYEEMFMTAQPEMKIEFNTTMTNHQIEIAGVKKWVCYLRIERSIQPKDNTNPEEIEKLLIHNQAYRFKDTQERMNPNTPWKEVLLKDAITRLIAGGLEYAELLKRMQNVQKLNAGKPLADAVGAGEKKLDLVITDKMPEPLSPEDLKYKQWLNNERQG